MKKLLHALAGLLALQAASVFADDNKFESFSIQKVSGSASKIKAAGASDFKAAQPSETYKAGSVGKTGDQSTITIAFDAENQFRLLPNTEVSISTSTRDPKFRKVVDLTMEKGGVKVDLDNFPKNYQLRVQTPTAVCGAVGTRFEVTSSKDGTSNNFQCDRGSISAKSIDDNGFDAPVISKGQTLQAKAAPGKDNSYTQLSTQGGDMQVAVGSSEKVNVAENSSFEYAKERGNNPVALHVKKGSVGGNKEGHYLVDGDKVQDFAKKENGPALMDDYIVAAQKEGDTKAKLGMAKDDATKEKLEEQLDRDAKDANEKRKAMMEFRRVLGDTIGSGLRQTMGGSRPTSSMGH